MQISNKIFRTCFYCCSLRSIVFRKPNTNTSLSLEENKTKGKKKILTKTAYANVSHSPLRSTGHLLLSLPCSSPCPVSYRLFESSGECRKSDIIETEGRHIVTHSYRWRPWRTDSISAGEDGSGTFLSPLNFFYFLFFFLQKHAPLLLCSVFLISFPLEYHPPGFGLRLFAFTNADWAVRSHVDGDRCPRSDPFSPSSSRLIHTRSRWWMRNVCRWRPVGPTAGPPP